MSYNLQLTGSAFSDVNESLHYGKSRDYKMILDW